jgi:XTP/dITP diphosphohydrolase
VKLYFVTVNPEKDAEVQELFAGSNVEIEVAPHRIQEVLDLDLDEIARQKTLSAYRYLNRPCVVQHSGLFITALNDLPGGFTKEVWGKLGAGICGLIPPDDDRSAVAKSVVGHCDGRRIYLHHGEMPGTLTPVDAVSLDYSWAQIFVPEGSEKTFDEMSPDEKAEHSHTMKAWASLHASLTAPPP